MSRSASESRVGTLDNARGGRKMAVYERVDGSLYTKPDGIRENVHGNAHWTHLSGTKMRGKSPIQDGVNASFNELPMDPEEAEDLERAIAASLEEAGLAPPVDVNVPNEPAPSAPSAGTSRACVVCLTDAADRVIKPCCHLCLCGGCAFRFQWNKLPCPVCRKNQRSIERVYLA